MRIGSQITTGPVSIGAGRRIGCKERLDLRERVFGAAKLACAGKRSAVGALTFELAHALQPG
jgi:hypothetical protein